jgi:hypothetical protein
VVDYLRPEDVPLTETLDEETLLWLRNRNRHDLLAIYEENHKSSASSTESSSSSESPEDEDYEKWMVSQLQQELDDRLKELSDEDKDEATLARLTYSREDRKPALVAKLRADDDIIED